MPGSLSLQWDFLEYVNMNSAGEKIICQAKNPTSFLSSAFLMVCDIFLACIMRKHGLYTVCKFKKVGSISKPKTKQKPNRIKHKTKHKTKPKTKP